MMTQSESKKNIFIKTMLVLLAFLPLCFFSTNKTVSADVYEDEVEQRKVEFQPNTKLFMWTGKQGVDGRAVVAPLRADNFMYPKEGTSKMRIKFIATNKVGVYQIQLPGNYFYVDDSRPFYHDGDSCYEPDQRYYVLGQRPKYSNLRASWEILTVPGAPDRYRLRNMATGRVLSVHIWDACTMGSPLRLVLRDACRPDLLGEQSFFFTKN